MLIDMLSASLAKSGALDDAWAKLDSGQDATVGVASSARPFLVAARFAADPRATLVVAAGEEAADTFARTVGAFVGEERVLRLPDYEGNPFSLDAPPQPRLHGRRLEALWSLQQGKPAVVVASARALLRRIARGASVDQIAEEDQVPREAVVGHLRQLLDDARTLSRLGAPQTQGR